MDRTVYRRAWYAANGDAVLRYRIAAAKNLLAKHGLLAVAMPPALPWSDLQQRSIVNAVRTAMEKLPAAEGGDRHD